MAFQDQSIKRKAMTVMMVTAIAVLVLSAVVYTVQDLLTYRENLARSLSATAAVVAENSVAALALKDEAAGQTTLSSLRADTRVVAAALYDGQGKLFARYPAKAPLGVFPTAPGTAGYRFEDGHLTLFQSVAEGSQRFGTFYLKSGRYPLAARLRLFGSTVVLVLLGSIGVALVIANVLQRRITEPVLALAEMAKIVSERGDYSIRAQQTSHDEIGVLTDAFNRMLSRIEEQTEALSRNEKVLSFLAAIVESSDDAIVGKDLEGNVVSWNAAAERMFGYTADGDDRPAHHALAGAGPA